MKKTVSLILAVMMLLGCMSITAFAENVFSLRIDGVEVTTEGVLDTATFTAITDGTVTYTAAEHNNGTAKLTLDNATIIAPTGKIGIRAQYGDLVIELIGDNTIQSPSNNGIEVIGKGTFIGNGSLSATCGGAGVSVDELYIGMRGTLTATSTTWCGICADNIFIMDGAGKISAYGVEGYAALCLYEGTAVNGYKTAFGSADANEDDVTKMSPVTFAYTVEGDLYANAAMVGDPAVPALSLVISSNPATSGTTDIKAVKAAPFSYEIVIPTDVAEITAAGVYEVGQAKVTNVVSATEDTVISYTATTTNFKCSGKSDLPATYYTEEDAENEFPTAAVKVYENKADVANLPTMWVKIADSDWNAAAAGTYHATVTFNFEAEEAEPVLSTVADVLATVPGGFPDDNTDDSLCWKDNNGWVVRICVGKLNTHLATIDLTNAVTKDGDNNYTASVSGGQEPYAWTDSWLFTMTDGVLTEITITSTGENPVVCRAPETT